MSSSADIIVLTETWLRRNIRDCEILDSSKQFHFYRRDREARQGGGVLVAVKKKPESFALNIPSGLEIVWISAKLSHRRIVLGACYRPPNSSATFVADLHDTMNAVVSRYPTCPILLLGDFNYPDIVWSATVPFSRPFSSSTQQFIDFCLAFNLTQVVSEPTRVTQSTANILDLALTNCPDLCSEITYMPKLSGHVLLNFSVTIPVQKCSKKRKTIRNYHKASF